jgi:peptidoglycan/xylan/chitin deacetylase (PgdA/CDA1 family)
MATLSLRGLGSNIIDTVGNALLRPPVGGIGYFYNHGSRNERKVALTFDDGPNTPSTVNLLNALDTLQVRATFFCLGLHAQMHPDLIQRIYNNGHTIGNHSMAHHRKDSLLPTSDGKHIDESAQAIASIIGRRPRLYRPPWGWLTPWEGRRLQQRGYSVIGWDVYTLDWKLPEIDGKTLAEGMYRDIQPGSIALLHDSNGIVPESHKIEMTRAVQMLVPRLRAEGYEFVTVPQLLRMPAYLPLL